ncbi:MAG TPA: hypothetical protein VGJ53_03495 [Micromonosporaceae bacterium]|jgi:hypothetical protein
MPETGNGGIKQAVTWLSGGLVLLTASLGAVGGLTGGIARMFRNSDPWQIQLGLGLVLLGVLCAVISGIPHNKPAAIILLSASIVLFGFGTYWSLSLMVATSRVQDRPALSAQLAFSDESGWVLKVQSSSSGLDADDQLQVLVYAQPKRGTRPAATPPTPARTPTRPAPQVTRTPAHNLDGDRLLFTQAGANIDGIASQNIEVPIPVDRGYDTIIVTAVLGNFPRDCEGRTVNVRDNTELLVPPEVTGTDGVPVEKNGTLSCVTLAAPFPPAVPTVAATVPSATVP